MKIQILVLDVFTNGHEAARKFMHIKGWKEEDCEIIFCGSHDQVFDRLIEGPAYAVVPIRNSIARPPEVTEVVNRIEALRIAGYEIEECDRIEVQINHCLMSLRGINAPEDLGGVMSHAKALQQCGKFLNRIGITATHRIARNSTSGAAKAVAHQDPASKIGAIASREAAQEYGLKILAENIQDVPENITTFVLLQNEALVESVTVGIIGIDGKFGKMLKAFFERLGCEVIGSDQHDPNGLSNAEVVERSEVVLFSVFVDDTPAVIRSVLPHVRRDQLLMDVTSLKVPAVEAMLESEAQVVGLHPMFRPEGTFEGQTIVACLARLTAPHWKTWVMNMLAATHAKITWSDAQTHDQIMTAVQALPHASNLASAVYLAESGISVSESLEYTSPIYRIMYALMGRMVGQSPGLYTSIIMRNPQSLEMLKHRIEIEQRLVRMIERDDVAGFEGLFAQAHAHFGSEAIQDGNVLFVRMHAVLTTLYGKNSVVLEFEQKASRPGLLEKVCEVFSRRHINLKGINSAQIGPDVFQVSIGFEQPKTSDEVRRALEEIEHWEDPKVRVLA